MQGQSHSPDWKSIDTVLLDMDGTLLDLGFDMRFWEDFLPRRYAESRGVTLEEAHRLMRPIFENTKETLDWYCIDYWSRALSLDFTSTANTTEHTLLIRQSDVKQLWTVTLNGARLGALVPMEADLVHALPVPPGALRDGANTLRIDAKTADDIVLHRIDLRPIASRALLAAAHLELDVRDERGVPLPARLTVLDEQGFLAAMQGESPPGRLAVPDYDGRIRSTGGRRRSPIRSGSA